MDRLAGAERTELDIKPEPGPQSLSDSSRGAVAPERERYAVFLDVDGTLLALVETPEEAEASPADLDVLRRLASALDGALALVSGRRITDFAPRFRRFGRDHRNHGHAAPGASPPMDGDDAQATRQYDRALAGRLFVGLGNKRGGATKVSA